jgi:ubiquitin C-terminal hydrolase
MIERPGTPDDVVAQQAWKTHLQRNNSIIVDFFQGQLKSSVTCTTCKTASRNFEAFMNLSLPLQSPIVEYPYALLQFNRP